MSSCTKQLDLIEPQIDHAPSLQVYLERFVDEGEARGYHFHLNEIDLTMRFGNHDENVAGTCSYDYNAVHREIVIDSAYMNNPDLLLPIMMHELGHCLLLRDHRPGTFQDGTCVSFMVPDLSCFNTILNPTMERYYFDELFDSTTNYPT